MSVNIKITIAVDTASPHIERIRAALADRTELHAVLGAAGEAGLRDHFLSRPANKMGWPSQGFWSQIRNATVADPATKEGVTITIADRRFNQKLYGGTIRPREAKLLAIPAIAEAYGKSPRSVPNLHLIFGRGGQAVGLAENEASEIRIGKPRKDGSRGVTHTASRTGQVWYWLVKSVTQRADPEALPPEQAYRQALLATVDQYFDALRG